MVRPVVSCADAIEARLGRRTARGVCGRWFLHRTCFRRLFCEALVQSWFTGELYSPASCVGNNLCLDLCLSSHRTSPQAPGFSNCHSRNGAYLCAIRGCISSECTPKSDRADSACWTTHRIVMLNRRSDSVQCPFGPGAMHRSRNGCVRRGSLPVLQHLA